MYVSPLLYLIFSSSTYNALTSSSAPKILIRPTQLNPAKEYKRLLSEAEVAFDKKTTRQKYGKDQRYQSFREGIWVSSPCCSRHAV